MNSPLLYCHTLRYLKPGQIRHQLLDRFRKCGVDARPAPPCRGVSAKGAFAAMPVSYLGDWRFRFLNTEHRLESPGDWERRDWNPLWVFNLHYFDHLRQPGLSEADGNATIARWIAENPPPDGNAYDPYTSALRISNWIKWHCAGHRLVPEALDSLALQSRLLERRLEYRLLANHLLANAKGLTVAGWFFSGAEAEKWLKKGLDIYREQLPEQILADGGHFERSVMYHCIILEDLLDLCNFGVPMDLSPWIAKMLDFLAAATAPDGGIVRFNDAAEGIALSPEELFRYAERLGFARPAVPTGSVDLPASGYARLRKGDWTLFCDGAPIGPDYQPGHAHADTLTFELWHRGRRLVTDLGTGIYVDSPLRREQRSTAGHNTVCVDGADSSQVWGAHRVGKRAKIVFREFGDDRFTAAHNGYAPVIHRRSWRLADSGVEIEDELSGRGFHEAALRFHFAPDSKLEMRNGGVAVRDRDMEFLLELPENGVTALSESNCSPEFGRVIPSPTVCFTVREKLPVKIKSKIIALS